MDLSKTRRDYTGRGLEREDLAEDPFSQFTAWYNEATEHQLLEPNAMSLATVSPAGQPSLRTVLLKFFDARGFVFFTNFESRKAKEITENPRVSLLFPWIALERQVIVGGTAERLSSTESLTYFLQRPFGSQAAVWASPQSQVISSRSLIEAKWEEMKRKFSEGKVPLPSFWGGFRVTPHEVEFWQGGKDRMHDRFRYTHATPSGWQIDRLAP